MPVITLICMLSMPVITLICMSSVCLGRTTRETELCPKCQIRLFRCRTCRSGKNPWLILENRRMRGPPEQQRWSQMRESIM